MSQTTMVHSGTPVPSTVTIPRAALIAAGAGVLAIIALLVMVLIVLISTRDRSVSLDSKSSRLELELSAIVGAAEPALHAAEPTLSALPQTSSSAGRNAASARKLSAEAHQLLVQLTAAGLPGSLGPLTKLPASLVPLISLVDTVQEHDQVPALVSGLSQLSDSVKQGGLVTNASALLTHTPAILETLTQVRGLLGQIRSSHLVPVAVKALQELPSIRKLLASSLQTQAATLSTGRKTTTAVQAVSPTVIDDILSVAEQTLTHATSLDHKIGVVP